MVPARPYIPSVSLLRALSRPIVSRCPFVHRLSPQCLRAQTTDAKSSRRRTKRAPKMNPAALGLGKIEPPTDKDLGGVNNSRLESIELYEQDIGRKGPEVLIDRVANASDVKRIQDQQDMYKRWQTDANYDPTDLYRVSIERLMASPSFADLRDELEQMKADLQSKEERQAMDREAGASVQMDIYEAMQEMIDDPDAANARDDLIELQARLGELDTNPDSPELEELMIRLDQKLDANPEFQRKLVARLQEGGLDPALADKPLEELLPSGAEKWDMNKPRDVDALMDSMQKLLTGMGGDPAVDKELEHARDKPEHPDELEPDEEDEELLEREFQAFSDDLSKLKDAPAPEDLEADKISPDLEAQVDKILDDPHLMEKLAFIKKMMDEAKSSESIFQNTSAPDPEKLDSADTTTLGKRLKTTEDDPEHIVGLRRLHIDLPSPFNVSPALKSLNEALKLAYVGANDDVRRILWRAYSKARNVPTLLQNMPDDAWDMVWYSQAVTWGSNQNRDDHLRVLMEDLQSVGRDGPPTHPEMLEDVE